jgi:hypothetical protein
MVYPLAVHPEEVIADESIVVRPARLGRDLSRCGNPVRRWAFWSLSTYMSSGCDQNALTALFRASGKAGLTVELAAGVEVVVGGVEQVGIPKGAPTAGNAGEDSGAARECDRGGCSQVADACRRTDSVVQTDEGSSSGRDCEMAVVFVQYPGLNDNVDTLVAVPHALLEQRAVASGSADVCLREFATSRPGGIRGQRGGGAGPSRARLGPEHAIRPAVPKDIDLDRLTVTMAGVDGVETVHDLHVWSLSSEVRALSAHVVLEGHPSLEEAQAVGERLKAAVGVAFSLAHVTLELECEACDDGPCGMDGSPRLR